MLLATITFSARGWLFPCAIAFLAGCALVVWSYRRSAARPLVKLSCAVLKLLGLAALLACLLEPMWNGERAKPGANFLVMVADNSQGMLIKDRDQTHSRGDQLRELLTGERSHWQKSVDEQFQVRRYVVDSRLEPVKDFEGLNFEGRASALATGLRTIADRLKGQPVAGLVLFTDGNATDLPTTAMDLTGLPPLYPVVLGEDTPINDISIEKVAVTQTAFEDAPVSIQVDVRTTGFRGTPVVARVYQADTGVSQTSAPKRGPPIPSASKVLRRDGDEADPTPLETPNLVSSSGRPGATVKPLLEETQTAKADGDTLSFRFQLRPERSGVLFYRVQVSTRDDVEQFERAGQTREATLANNLRAVIVDRGQGPYRILFVGGRPSWEYKFLNRAIIEDPQIQMVSLIRVARREAKFEFRARAGESSNPLFRGFDRKTEETERYDQPVLVRLNTRDEHELRSGFPKTAEELYAYHAVIVDDMEADFFTADQRLLLQKFVSDRGGGFLMLGGQESFHEGKYDRTPVGEMLPVYLGANAPDKVPGDLHFQFTREGWLQPWLRLRSTQAEETTRLHDVPPFQVLNSIRGIKPGATIMAEVIDDKGYSQPALVVQRFGFGRTAALLVGDLWRSGLKNDETEEDLGKAWRQMIRWLVADTPNRITVQVEEQKGDPTQAVEIQTRVRTESFQPLDNARVLLAVNRVVATAAPGQDLSSGAQLVPGAPNESNTVDTVRLTADPDNEEAGLYRASYIPRFTGGYAIEAAVTNAAGAEVGRAQGGWTTDLASDEFRSLKPNRAWLEMLAAGTGGEVISADKLDAFARSLPLRHVPVTESYSVPLWHQPAVFLLALACFVAEWGLRRWKGLP